MAAVLLVNLLNTFGKYEHVQKSAGVRVSINVHKMYFHKISSTQLKKQSITSSPGRGLPATPQTQDTVPTSSCID